MRPKLIFYGGVGTTTGANIMLLWRDKKILIDCGLLQSRQGEAKNFAPFAYDPKTVDFLLVTHAHMDHLGLVPKLVREGFSGQIISTVVTKELARPMLEDALRVMHARHPDRIIFEKEDIEKALSLWEGRPYREKIQILPDCFLEMQNAGHILGSAILNVTCGAGETARRLAFTGDLGNSPSPLLPDAEVPEGADCLVMESVYGDRNHDSKAERRQKLKALILDGVQNGRTMIVPVFSIERTQVLLYELNNMIEDGEIPKVPVFFDSPLALKVTAIYQKYQKDFKETVKKEIKAGDDIFDFPGLQIVGTAEESRQIDKISGAKIILSGSGMSEGGRVVNHEIHYLPDPNAMIVLVGYQSVGSLGRKLQDGAKEITHPTLPYTKGGQGKQTNSSQKIKVRAQIESILGYSSHMDSEHLLEFVEKANPKKIFVIMGETQSSLFLVQRIRDYLDLDATYPEEGREYEL